MPTVEATAAVKRRVFKVCLVCGADISLRGRRAYMCQPCAHKKEVADDHQYKLRYRMDKLRKAHALSRAVGLEYEHQANSRDGRSYIITNQGRSLHCIEKVCQDCQRTDEEVRGWWAPIFSSFDNLGNELKPVLLCLVCYQLEIDRCAELEKRYA